MSITSSSRKSLLLCLLVTLFVIAVFLDGNPIFDQIELKVQDTMFRFRGERAPSGDVVICALDDASLEVMGWPMKRDKVGQLITGLRRAGAGAILCDFDWRNVAPSESVEEDSVLLWSLSGDDRVILPLSFTYADLGVALPPTPPSYERSAWSEQLPPGCAVAAQALSGPEPLLVDSATAAGGITPMLEPDRIVRWSPLLIEYGSTAFASDVLWAVSLHDDVGRTSWWLEPHEAIKVGEERIPTDDRGRLLLNFLGDAPSFAHHSAKNFLGDAAPEGTLTGKIVVVGPTGYRGSVNVATRTEESVPSVELKATAIENAIHAQFIRRSTYSALFDLLALVLIGILCAVVLPKIALLYRFVVLGIFLFVIVNLQYLTFASFGWLTHTFYPALELVFFMAISPFIRSQEEQLASEQPHKPTPRSTRPSAEPSLADSARGTGVEERTELVSSSTADPTAFKQDSATGAVAQVDKTRSMDHSGPIPTAALRTYSPTATIGPPYASASVGTPPQGVPTGTLGIDQPPPATAELPVAAPEPADAGRVSSGGVPTSSTPQFLGRYQLLEELGRGAMGVVYRGIDPAINRPVALKTVRLDLAAPPAEKEELRSRLLREAQAAGQLSHPNIVTIYDVGSQGDVHYIAMEFLKGYTLERAVAKKMTLNYKIFAKLMIQVCDALEYAHGNELVHRDIKPANIMVLDNFKVKVMDFGIARVAHSEMTQTGVALGTPSYISPEQLSGQGVDRRSDVFSLGVVMYELLTKDKPFRGDTISKLIYNILNEKPRRPTELDNNIPHAFDLICARALEKDPRQRYQYAADLARDLKEFIASLSPQRVSI
jgi:serine/threonine-protein kinase